MTDTGGLCVTFPRLALLEAITAVGAHAGAEPLGLFVAADDTVTITASTGDMGARYTYTPVAVTWPYEFAILLKPLADVLRCSDGASVRVAITREAVVVTIAPDTLSARRFDFLHHNPQVVPVPDPTAATENLTLPSAEFRRLVSHVAFAAERRERESVAGGWATSGALVTLSRKHLSLAATDTHRMAHSRLTLSPPRKSSASPTYLLPVRAWKAFADASRGCDAVALQFTPAIAAITAGPLFAWASLLNCSFPPVAGVLAELQHSVTLPRARLLADVEAALAFTETDDPVIVLAAAPGLVTVSPESSERGTCELVSRIPGFTGPRLTVALYGPRLAGALAAYADSEEVTIKWQSEERPILIQAGESRCLLAPRIVKERAVAA